MFSDSTTFLFFIRRAPNTVEPLDQETISKFYVVSLTQSIVVLFEDDNSGFFLLEYSFVRK